MRTIQLQKVFSLILSAVIILAACQTQTQSSLPLFATLKELSGTVSIKQASAAGFVKASGGEVLNQNGSVQTGDDGRVRLDLSTGTIIRISPSSLFTLVSNKQSDNSLATELKLDVGRLFIILNGGSVDVQTPSGVATVAGSYLSVEVDPTTLDVYVTCLEGHCGASNGAGGVDFGSGQKTILFHCDPATGKCSVPSVGPMSDEDFQKWLDENPEAKEVLDQAHATMTALAASSTEAPATEPPATATNTPIPEPKPTGCGVIGPLGGSDLPKYGVITFAWNAQDGASKYIVTFHYPNGGGATFETTDPNLQRDMDTVKGGGDYSWDVQAVDGNGNQLCHSDPVQFSKPQYGPDKPKPSCNPCNISGPCYDFYAQGCGG